MVFAALVTTLLLLTTSAAAHQGAPADVGIIESVIPGSPAAAAGMRDGDRLIRLDGQKIETLNDLQKVTEAHAPGDKVPMAVERDSEIVELDLTFGERPDGGVSIGIRINLAAGPGADGDGEKGTTECLAWIDKTYKVDSMMQNLGLDLSEVYETMRQCVGRDTRMMSTANAIRYCDNVFKVHCSGVDLLTEIGEAQVEQCGELLGESLGVNLKQYKGWKTCAEQRVFERYSMSGESSDEEACHASFLEECGTNIDGPIRTDELSPEQQEFTECCSAEAIGTESRGNSDQCEMIDDGFARGPCHDRLVCINRSTSEWFHCQVLDR